MTHTLFMHIQDEDGVWTKAAILSESDESTLNDDYDQILTAWERQHGYRPTELDS